MSPPVLGLTEKKILGRGSCRARSAKRISHLSSVFRKNLKIVFAVASCGLPTCFPTADSRLTDVMAHNRQLQLLVVLLAVCSPVWAQECRMDPEARHSGCALPQALGNFQVIGAEWPGVWL